VTNEIANLAAALGGIDAIQVMRGVHLDRRWNPIRNDGSRVNPQILTYLFPGCGFGGSCFPKDVLALATQGRQVGLPMHVLHSVLKVNEEQPKQVLRLLAEGLGDLREKKIAVLGLAFKPGTDDIRHSPSLTIIRELVAQGAQLSAADPVAHVNARTALGSLAVGVFPDWQHAVRDADAVAIVTAWDEYRNLPPQNLRNLMRGDLIVDARRILPSGRFRHAFRVFKIGHVPRPLRPFRDDNSPG